MNKKYTLIVILLTMLFSVPGCKRDQLHGPASQNPQLISQVQLWYNKQIEANKALNNSFVVPKRATPDWGDYVINKTGPEEYSIFVKTTGRQIANPDVSTISSLVFSSKNGNITSGTMIEAIGESSFIKKQELQFVYRYQDKSIPGFTQGAFIISDMKYRVRSTYTIINGSVDHSVKTLIQKAKNISSIEVKVNGKKSHLILNSQQEAKLKPSALGTTGSCDTIWQVVWEIGTGRIISVTYLGIECEGDGDDDDGGVGDDEGSGGDNNDNLPPDAIIDKKDPCIEKGIINKNNANAIIAAQNAEILSKSTTNEYGADQNLKSMSSTSDYLNTAVKTNNSTDGFGGHFTWDSTNGYTIGMSHGHPGNDAPSPEDIFSMNVNLQDLQGTPQGTTDALDFYKANVSRTVVTKAGSYVVTVKDWGKLQTLFDRYKDDSGGFDDDFVNNGGTYYDEHKYLGVGMAGVYALMSIFGDAINIYYSPDPTTPYSPLTVDPGNVVVSKPCP